MSPALGSLEQVGAQWRLRHERRLAHPADEVWAAITEPEHLAAWFPSDIVGERKAGATLHFPYRDQDLPPGEGRVLQYEPPSRFEFTWGGDTLRFTLAEDGDGTLLELTVLLAGRGKAARDGAGWHECLDLLADDLDGRPGGAPGARWATLAPSYVETFGPEASTVGPPERWQQPGT
jgi:uncharacterized protein YndB with AHSA1/START domain